jgi:hypothetical protein
MRPNKTFATLPFRRCVCLGAAICNAYGDEFCARIGGMILWGSISEFPLFSVLQYLSSQRSSGVLEIQDYEEQGCVYITHGRIDAITMPFSDELFGERLMAAGYMTSRGIRQVRLQHGEEDLQRPVMAALLEAAGDDLDGLTDVVNKHTAEQVMQLMYWNNGTFRLSELDEPVRFPVVPNLSIENLLLDAYRRVDEGERPPREKLNLDEGICAMCTLGCSQVIKERYLKNDVCLWRNMPSVMKDPLFKNTLKAKRRLFEEDQGDDLEFL